MNQSTESQISKYKEIIRNQLNQGTAPAAIQSLLEAEYQTDKIDFYKRVFKVYDGTVVSPVSHQTDLAALKALLGV